jgi:hypothetical protein
MATHISDIPIIRLPTLRVTFSFNREIPTTSRYLEHGKIILVNGNSIISFAATSGLPGYQYKDASKIKGRGRAPTCKQANINSYLVATTPLAMPNTKGVNGNFYPITPFIVEVNGHPRGDLGIHRDANVPGSAGCLVITIPDHWIKFEAAMKALSSDKILSIPLFIS